MVIVKGLVSKFNFTAELRWALKNCTSTDPILIVVLPKTRHVFIGDRHSASALMDAGTHVSRYARRLKPQLHYYLISCSEEICDAIFSWSPTRIVQHFARLTAFH